MSNKNNLVNYILNSPEFSVSSEYGMALTRKNLNEDELEYLNEQRINSIDTFRREMGLSFEDVTAALDSPELKDFQKDWFLSSAIKANNKEDSSLDRQDMVMISEAAMGRDIEMSIKMPRVDSSTSLMDIEANPYSKAMFDMSDSQISHHAIGPVARELIDLRENSGGSHDEREARLKHLSEMTGVENIRELEQRVISASHSAELAGFNTHTGRTIDSLASAFEINKEKLSDITDLVPDIIDKGDLHNALEYGHLEKSRNEVFHIDRIISEDPQRDLEKEIVKQGLVIDTNRKRKMFNDIGISNEGVGFARRIFRGLVRGEPNKEEVDKAKKDDVYFENIRNSKEPLREALKETDLIDFRIKSKDGKTIIKSNAKSKNISFTKDSMLNPDIHKLAALTAKSNGIDKPVIAPPKMGKNENKDIIEFVKIATNALLEAGYDTKDIEVNISKHKSIREEIDKAKREAIKIFNDNKNNLESEFGGFGFAGGDLVSSSSLSGKNYPEDKPEDPAIPVAKVDETEDKQEDPLVILGADNGEPENRFEASQFNISNITGSIDSSSNPKEMIASIKKQTEKIKEVMMDMDSFDSLTDAQESDENILSIEQLEDRLSFLNKSNKELQKAMSIDFINRGDKNRIPTDNADKVFEKIKAENIDQAMDFHQQKSPENKNISPINDIEQSSKLRNKSPRL